MEKEFSIVLLFSHGNPFVHECSANFRSLFSHFYGFSSKLPEIAKFSLKIVIFFVILNTSLSFWLKILSGGGRNFQFSADFHEYTLNMTSYRVTEAN